MSRRVWSILVAVIAAGMIISGLTGIAFADEGLQRSSMVVDGRPMTLVRTAEALKAGTRRPGAVVVHGFAGSARLMLPYADTLARNGYVVVLPDLSGHAANRSRLNLGTMDTSLDADLDAAVRFLRSRPDVSPTRTVLVGHSMGAGAVTRYAATHADIAATVAISLPSADDLPAEASRPRNLLLLYGAYEFSGFAEAASQALNAPDPTASYQLRRTYGDVALGTARRAEAIPHVEHISILYSEAAHEATLAWLDAAALPAGPSAPVQPTRRLTPAELLLVGLLLGFYPLVHLLLRQPKQSTGESVASWRRFGLALGAGVIGGLALSPAPDAAFGLAVAGYTALVFAGFAVASLVVWVLLVRGSARLTRSTPSLRELAVGLLLTAYVAVAIAVPTHLGLTYTALVPSRWWLLGVVGVACFGLFLAAELIGGRRALTHAIAVGTALVLLTGLTLTGIGPGFTLLVLPILAGLLVLQAGLAAMVRQAGGAPWVAAAVGAALLAWPITATLPLV